MLDGLHTGDYVDFGSLGKFYIAGSYNPQKNVPSTKIYYVTSDPEMLTKQVSISFYDPNTGQTLNRKFPVFPFFNAAVQQQFQSNFQSIPASSAVKLIKGYKKYI